jgi:hypothetical protein
VKIVLNWVNLVLNRTVWLHLLLKAVISYVILKLKYVKFYIHFVQALKADIADLELVIRL